MQFVYPQSFLTPRLPDEILQGEATLLPKSGHSITLINAERLPTEQDALKQLNGNEPVVYRGWMLFPVEYENFVLSVKNAGGCPLSSTSDYLATHYLPNWYPLLSDLTPATIILPLDADWVNELKKLGWSKFFVKDYVKSLKTSVGSIIETPEAIREVVAEMKKFRGAIEGGLCIRQVEDFLPETEKRYFVLNGKPHSADPKAPIPDIASKCAKRINSKFFSVDTIYRADGLLRIVEIGDGQVSDLIGWSVQRFVNLWDNAV